jgi:hypothetical protein
MSPNSFALLKIAAAERFAQQRAPRLARDDIREIRDRRCAHAG